MAYEFVKAKGRVAFYKDGDFHLQQFKGHWAYRDPAAYIAQLEAWDVMAAEERDRVRQLRLAAAAEYLAKRAARPCYNQLVMEF